METFDFRFERIGDVIINDDIVGDGASRVAWRLGGDDGADSGRRATVARAHALDLPNLLTIDYQHAIHRILHAGFHQQRDHRNAVRRAKLTQTPRNLLAHAGMQDGFKLVARAGSIEHEPPQRASIQLSVGEQQMRTESFDDTL